MFRKFTTILFVFLYLISMLRPIAPFVEYAINYDYISKILCINKDNIEMNCKGKCQLMQKLEEQQEKDHKSLRIHLEEYPIGFVKILHLNVKKFEDKTLVKYQKYTNEYSYLYSYNVFHPPII